MGARVRWGAAGLVCLAWLGGAARLRAQAAPAPAPAWQDTSLPPGARAADLVGRMTLEEKVSQLVDQAAAIPRLGIPSYPWWNEALHGVARAGLATSFPQAIGMAATWDTSLIYREATVISDEARAKYQEILRQGGTPQRFQGLTFWSPNVNLFRDPRWGRGQETYGEDPFLSGRLAVQFVRGLQGDDPKYLKTVSTPKHFAVHSGPEPARHTFDVRPTERDLHETYLPQFKAAVVEGGAQSVMCAYNRVDSAAACASDLLLKSELRGRWHFGGYVVSDCDAVGDIYRTHKVAGSAAEAAAMALKAGTDLDCGRTYDSLVAAVRQGLVSETLVDTAVIRLFTTRFWLGMFDPPSQVRWAQIPFSDNDSPAHRALALDVAHESMVLLKNAGGLLPLKKDAGTIAVIGPDADQAWVLLDHPQAVLEPLGPLMARYRLTAEAYSVGAELSYHTGRHVAVFGTGSSHARQDDIDTDWRRFDGRDLLILQREPPELGRYRPYFREVEAREVPALGTVHYAVLGRNFDYAAYRAGVLSVVRERWYRIPAWLPRASCFFFERYGFG